MKPEYIKNYARLEQTHWWFAGRRFILKTLISKILAKSNFRTPLTVLNAGVGGGDTSVMLQDFGKVRSVEYDAELYQYCRDEKQLDIDLASVLDLPYKDNSFDMVCVFDVLEHIDDDRKALEELCRVVKPGGFIFITVPAYRFLWSGHDVVNEHCRRYTLSEMNRKAQAVNLAKFYSSYFNTFLFPPIAFTRWIKNLLKKKEPLGDFTTPVGPVNKILLSMFRSEIRFLYPQSLPFGVSIFAAYRKTV